MSLLSQLGAAFSLLSEVLGIVARVVSVIVAFLVGYHDVCRVPETEDTSLLTVEEQLRGYCLLLVRRTQCHCNWCFLGNTIRRLLPAIQGALASSCVAFNTNQRDILYVQCEMCRFPRILQQRTRDLDVTLVPLIFGLLYVHSSEIILQVCTSELPMAHPY